MYIRKDSKKGFISIEWLFYAAVFLFVLTVFGFSLLDKGKESYDKVMTNKEGLVMQEVDELKGIYIDPNSGQSIHKDFNANDEIQPPNEGGDIDDGKVHVKEIQVNPKDVTLDKNETVKINYELIPTIQNGVIQNTGVTWLSSDDSIAKVTQNGIITGINAGEATITVRAHDNAVFSEIKVIVNPVKVSKIETNVESLKLKSGENFQITTKVIPDDATNKKVQYFIEDEDLAEISSLGLVTAKDSTINHYKTNIIIKVDDVTKKIPLEIEGKINITTAVNVSPEEMELQVGATKKIDVSIEPSDASDKSIIFESTDKSLATVSTTGVVAAQKVGVAYINVCNTGGSFFGKKVCNIVTVNVVPKINEVESMILSYGQKTIESGTTLRPSLIFKPEDTTDKRVTWQSSDNDVITVDSNGVITGVKDGVATITATSLSNPEITADFEIETVGYKKHPSQINIVNGDLELEPDDVVELIAEVSPNDATIKTVRWSTSDTAIASIDDNGMLTAISPGTAIITATSTDNGIQGTIFVTVKTIPVERVDWNVEENIIIGINEQIAASAKAYPDKATNKTVEYEIGDESIVSYVDGIIKAKNYGKTTIIAKSVDGPYAEINVEVKYVMPERIELSVNELSVSVGETKKVDAKVSPENAENKDIYWVIIDDEEPKVSIDAEGNITGLQAGVTTVRAVSVADESVYADLEITVEPIKVSSIKLFGEGNPIVFDEIGTSQTLSFNVFPDDADNKDVIFITDDSNIVTVDDNGILTSVSEGETDVELLAADSLEYDDAGNITNMDTAVKTKVHVIVNTSYVKATDISLIDDTNQLISVGDTRKLNAKVSPDNATVKDLIWSSSDESIATVDSDGNVVGVSEGKAFIIVSHVDDISSVYEVTVKNPAIERFIVSPDSIEMEPGEEATYSFDSDKNLNNVSYRMTINSNPYVQNEQVISVDQETKTIKALHGGEVMLTFDVDNMAENVSEENYINTIKVKVNAEYKIDYITNGGTLDTGVKDTYTYSDEVILPDFSEIRKDGYAFDGWYDNTTFSGSKIDKITANTAGDKTFYAKWIANKYTISFNAVDGETSLASKEVHYNSAIGSLPIPTRSGYIFDGWYTSPTEGSEYTSDTVYKVTSDIILYAHWSPAYDIVYDVDGGTMPDIFINQYSSKKESVLPVPRKEGYEFKGWSLTRNIEPLLGNLWNKDDDGNLIIDGTENEVSTFVPDIDSIFPLYRTMNFTIYGKGHLKFDFEYKVGKVPSSNSNNLKAGGAYRIYKGDILIKSEEAPMPSSWSDGGTFFMDMELEPGDYKIVFEGYQDYYASVGQTGTIKNLKITDDELLSSIKKGRKGNLQLKAKWEVEK